MNLIHHVTLGFPSFFLKVDKKACGSLGKWWSPDLLVYPSLSTLYPQWGATDPYNQGSGSAHIVWTSTLIIMPNLTPVAFCPP